MSASTPSSPSSPRAERVEISCPGCGRHDWVTWPAEASTLRWKCFNCGRESVLSRKGGAH